MYSNEKIYSELSLKTLALRGPLLTKRVCQSHSDQKEDTYICSRGWCCQRMS